MVGGLVVVRLVEVSIIPEADRTYLRPFFLTFGVELCVVFVLILGRLGRIFGFDWNGDFCGHL